MSDDRWRRVEELYHAGLGVSPERRAAFLEDACGGDSELRREVESLLVQHKSEDSVLDRPAWDQPAWTGSRPDGQSVSLAEALLVPGAVLGPYRITGLLGEGGMGQVYRAHDSRLQRSVAIKVLFPGQDVRRFQREARAVAALSHPNVVPIFDVGHESGVDYLVEELVEGESLRDILRRGRLNVARFRHLAAQIAGGLAAAHRAGIIHRDLKPGNIMVSRDDCARILDFGLATRHRTGSDESSISVPHFAAVIGTAAYMSPEQVQGSTIDARSDIFSYGAVLYEMITGRRAFARETITATLAAVVEADPPPVESVPHKLAQIIYQCLSKDPSRRFQEIDDVRFAIDDLQKDTDPAIVFPAAKAGGIRKTTPGETLRFGVFEVDLATAELRKQGVRLQLQDQPFQVLAALLERPGEVVTREDLIHRIWPDGTVADFDQDLNAAVTRLRQALSDSADVPRYVETVAGRGYRFIGSVERASDEARPARLPMQSRHGRTWAPTILITTIALIIILFGGWWWWTRGYTSRSEAPLKIVPLTAGAGVERNPSFSPDGTQIVYEWEREDGQRHIYIKVVGSGDPVALTSGNAADYGPAWSPDGRLIGFLRQLDQSTMGVFVIPPLGGVERKLTEIAPPPVDSVLRQFHRRLDWTHDSRHLVVSAAEHASGSEGLLLVSVDSGERAWLTRPSGDSLDGDREPAVSPDGRMVAFARGDLGTSAVIHLLPLTSDLRPAGAPRRIASAGRSRSPAWTPDGKHLIYTDLSPGMTFGSGAYTIGLNTRDVPHPLVGLGNVAVPAVSRTGRLAYARQILEGNLWRQEIPARAGATPPPVRLTASSAVDFNAQYSPDGHRIAFVSNRSGNREIWTCASNGAQCVQVTNINGTFVTGSPHWSPDGKQLVFDSAAAGQADAYVVDAAGGSPRRLTDDATHAMVPSWSHDGKWIYFSSKVAGSNEIWKIPSAGGKALRLTRNGGLIAFESPDGKALYYTKVDQKASLWRSAVDGSGETQVLNGVVFRGSFVVADRVYYLRQEPDGSIGIRCFVIGTRQDSQIVSVARRIMSGLSLSPDGKYLLYSQVREASNLMLVEDFR